MTGKVFRGLDFQTTLLTCETVWFSVSTLIVYYKRPQKTRAKSEKYLSFDSDILNKRQQKTILVMHKMLLYSIKGGIYAFNAGK